MCRVAPVFLLSFKEEKLYIAHAGGARSDPVLGRAGPRRVPPGTQGPAPAGVRAPLSMRRVWTVTQRDGPNHLGLWLYQGHPRFFFMQHMWTVLEHDGPNHLGLRVKCRPGRRSSRSRRRTAPTGACTERSAPTHLEVPPPGHPGHSLSPSLRPAVSCRRPARADPLPGEGLAVCH